VLVELVSVAKREGSAGILSGLTQPKVQVQDVSAGSNGDEAQWPWQVVAVENSVMFTVEGSPLERVLAAFKAKATDALAIALLRHDEDGRVLVQRLRSALEQGKIDCEGYDRMARVV
jgi:hypothetical protein